MMIILWVTVLLLRQVYMLNPVTTVQLGERVTFMCVFSVELNTRPVQWYKQSIGDTLKLMITLTRASTKYNFEPGFPATRFMIKLNEKMSNLTIVKTIQEDQAMYHCGVTDWNKVVWRSTYLSLKGNAQRTSNYSVVQWPVSEPVHPGDSVTLQCSVLSDPKTKSCPGEHSVYWFRAGSDESHPNIIYTHENRSDGCEKSPETPSAPHSCVYSFSKNVSSSDTGTYYCAVATCGEILFGNGAKLEINKTAGPVFIALIVTAVCLALSVIGNIILICKQNPRAIRDQRKGIGRASSQAKHDDLSNPAHDRTEDGDGLNYAALHFSERKATRGQKKRELPEECVYSRVKR
ncbi:uncharacterized protein [Centroberyx affinis]|uniref:uncharacterized protein n=1 Tax=Centroberyx affinis TaxID=166261 RepID=UPI003A5BA51E